MNAEQSDKDERPVDDERLLMGGVHYYRVKALDKRIAKGDDFAGDAWVRYTAVGHIPDADPVAAVPECGTINAAPDQQEARATPNGRDEGDLTPVAAPTPRTESNLRGSGIRITHPFAEFARQLERELAHERKRAEAFKEAMLSYEQAARAERDGAVSASGKREFTAAEQIAMVKKAGYDKTKGHPDCYMDFSYSLLFAEIASRSTSGALTAEHKEGK